MDAYFEQQLLNKIKREVNMNPEPFPVNICKYPRYLGKIRQVDNYFFESLEEDYLYAANPAKDFYDPNDSIIPIDKHTMLRNTQELILSDLQTFVKHFITMTTEKMELESSTRASIIDQYVDKFEKIQIQVNPFLDFSTVEEFQEKIEKVLDSNSCYIINALLQIYSNEAYNFGRKVSSIFQKKNRICSLTSDLMSQKMWEDYGDKYAGAMIVYDLLGFYEKDILKDLFPITYSETLKTIDASKEFYESINRLGKPFTLNERDMDSLIERSKISLSKQKAYECEAEWRIVTEIKHVPAPKPVKVVMGYRISQENESRLIQICKKHNITLEKQQFKQFNRSMFFTTIVP